ncbi:MAG: EamA family transporter [Spirochaetes bacterium]|nr:EamA family transporter [Spirochaetota bacterium]
MNWWILALISAAFSAAAAIYEKKSLFSVTAIEFSTVLAVFNLVLSLPLLFFFDIGSVSSLPLLVLFLKSIIGAFAFYLVMRGLKALEISNSLPLMVLTPGIVALASFFFLEERLTHFEIGGMIMLLAGTYLLQTGKIRNWASPFKASGKAHLYLLGAIALYSTTSVIDKLLVGRLAMQPLAFVFFQHLFLALIFTAVYLVSGSRHSQVRSVLSGTGKMIAIVAVFTIIYRLCQIEAVKLGNVALVLSVKRLSVFFAIVIGGRLFRDTDLFTRAVATAVMIAGAFLIVVMN